MQVEKPRIVIVGNGMVSHALCHRLVTGGASDTHDIVVIGEEPRPAYDRVRLTRYFDVPDAVELELASAEWYADNGIDLRTAIRAESIDPLSKSISCDSGESLTYDKLVLATGSRPWQPNIPGVDLDGVYLYRTLDDVDRIRQRAQRAKSAAVIGGGLLGLEAAKALHDCGLAVHIVELAPVLMPRQLDHDCGAYLKERIEELGCQVHLMKRTTAIEQVDAKKVLRFDGDESLPVDMVVISAGIRPRVELAKEAGLTLGERGGVRVNDHLETSDPSIFAVGECAEHGGIVYGLVGPGIAMANALGDNLLGGNSRFAGADQSARLKLLDVDVTSLGRPLGDAPNISVISAKGDDFARKLILLDRRVVGAFGVGPWAECERVRALIDAGGGIWPWQKKRFEATGCLWTSDNSVKNWPPSSIICSCKCVTKATIDDCVAAGCTSVETVAAATGASTSCGTCQPLVKQILGSSEATVSYPGRASLLAASLAALAVGVVLLLVGPVDAAESVASTRYMLTTLWRDEVLKQITGYTLAGIMLLSTVFTLRKRLPPLKKWGEYGHWRAIHAIVGCVTLGGLWLHTGGALGANLNLVLSTTFFCLALSGGITGVASSLESKCTGSLAIAIRKYRPWINQIHIWILIPLVVLLGIHIACVYYF